ncbi:MAG: hypothetical protein ACOYLX_21420 [Burkholderiaceae bacterium]
MQLKEVEAQVGVVLFDRTGRRLAICGQFNATHRPH